MWNVENRHCENRETLRYPSGVTEDEWLLIASIIPLAKRGGRRRSVDLREVVNGVVYVLSSKSQWHHMPPDLPLASTLFGYLDLWTHQGVIDRIHHALFIDIRGSDARRGESQHKGSLKAVNP